MKAALLSLFVGAGLLALGSEHFLHERQSTVTSGTVNVHGVASALGPSLPKVDMERFRRLPGEPLLPYVQRANDLLHVSTYSCFAYDFSLSWAEHLLSKYLGEKQFEWQDGLFGQELVCGLCHQRAITLAMLLRENNVDNAWAYGMSGHVVVKFTDEVGREYLSDPDYGVSPFPLLLESRAFEQLIRDKYGKFDITELVVRIITSLEDNSDYRSFEWATTVLKARNALYEYANYLATAAAVIGGFLLALSIVLARRSKRSNVTLSGILGNA